MKLFVQLSFCLISFLSINTISTAKTNSDLVVSVVVLSSCRLVTNNNTQDKDLDMKIISQCSPTYDSYITVQNIEKIKANNEYVLSNKENITITKTKENEEFHTHLQSKYSEKDSDKILVTINY